MKQKPGKGLRGADKQQDERRVQAATKNGVGKSRGKKSSTGIVRDQRGGLQPADKQTAQRAGTREPPERRQDLLPEGLRRSRKDPLNPHTGRRPA